MWNVSFTRDEVILALDVLYSAQGQVISPDSKGIIELSELLNRLPIHPQAKQNEGFRSPHGVSQQINTFARSCRRGEKSKYVGQHFYDISFEYEECPERLHNIAKAIRTNEKYFSTTFGAKEADYGFPEGALLGHLHHSIENAAQKKIVRKDRCEVCGINPALMYGVQENLLELHLMVLPEKMNGGTRYGQDCYMTVCPTCHAALHRIRPWVNRNNCGDILR